MNAIDIISLFDAWSFPYKEFRETVQDIGDICAIRYKKGKPFRRNYERGLLLMGIAECFKITRFLEFGTGRGFVTSCVSMVDSVEKICTIDKLDASKTFDVMKKCKKSQCEKVDFICKETHKLKDGEVGRDFDLVFIDGEHSGKAVKNDFEYTLKHIAPDAVIVFDDYRNKHKGVKKYIDTLNYDKMVVHSDGWIFKNTMLKVHGDADKIVDGKERGSGQVILYPDGEK